VPDVREVRGIGGAVREDPGVGAGAVEVLGEIEDRVVDLDDRRALAVPAPAPPKPRTPSSRPGSAAGTTTASATAATPTRRPTADRAEPEPSTEFADPVSGRPQRPTRSRESASRRAR
jgi:hypothetical protein